MKKMLGTRRLCQQVANGWSGQLKVAVDSIVKPQRCRQLVLDFYRQFPEVELLLEYEVYNGVWDALADERTDIVIGATSAVPVASHFSFRDMGLLNWLCVVSVRHPLAAVEGLLSDDQLRPFASLCMTDTSRNLPKRDTWTLDNQRRLVVPNWSFGPGLPTRWAVCRDGAGPSGIAMDRARRVGGAAIEQALSSQPIMRGVGAEQAFAGHGVVAGIPGRYRNHEPGMAEWPLPLNPSHTLIAFQASSRVMARTIISTSLLCNVSGGNRRMILPRVTLISSPCSWAARWARSR